MSKPYSAEMTRGEGQSDPAVCPDRHGSTKRLLTRETMKQASLNREENQTTFPKEVSQVVSWTGHSLALVRHLYFGQQRQGNQGDSSKRLLGRGDGSAQQDPARVRDLLRGILVATARFTTGWSEIARRVAVAHPDSCG